MSTLFLSIAIAAMTLLCVSAFVFILMFGTDEINIFKWRRVRKPKPEKLKSKWLDAVWNIQERQLEAEWEEQQIKEMKDEGGVLPSSKRQSIPRYSQSQFRRVD